MQQFCLQAGGTKAIKRPDLFYLLTKSKSGYLVLLVVQKSNIF